MSVYKDTKTSIPIIKDSLAVSNIKKQSVFTLTEQKEYVRLFLLSILCPAQNIKFFSFRRHYDERYSEMV